MAASPNRLQSGRAIRASSEAPSEVAVTPAVAERQVRVRLAIGMFPFME